MFTITEITRLKSTTEHQGTKYKFWTQDNELFKEGKVQGENWAELIAYNITTLLAIPSAEYKPAKLKTPNKKPKLGTLSPNFINTANGERLINANELLASWLGSKYDKSKTYKQKDYTFFTATNLINNTTCIKNFIGYLLFDTLIANQDRHHENWGFIFASQSGELSLSPTYDHGASLACRMREKERKQRMTTNDTQYSVKFFANKAKTPFYNKERLLKTYQIAELCIMRFPKESSYWIEKISCLSHEQLLNVINNISNEWMSATEKEFTLSLLLYNQQYLKELPRNV